jgi:hypothetical protein
MPPSRRSDGDNYLQNNFLLKKILTWQGVYYHFNEWTKDGSWTKVQISILFSNLQYLDLSCIQLDGSHTSVKRGGEAIGYQAGRPLPAKIK